MILISAEDEHYYRIADESFHVDQLQERLSLETHVDDLTDELSRVKSSVCSSDDEKRRLAGELSAAKKVSR